MEWSMQTNSPIATAWNGASWRGSQIRWVTFTSLANRQLDAGLSCAWTMVGSCGLPSKPSQRWHSRITRITSRCTVTLAPSTLKVSSEAPASRPSTRSTASGGRPAAAPSVPGRPCQSRVDQGPADPGGRQHGEQIHHGPGAAAILSGADGLQGQQDRGGGPARILARLLGRASRRTSRHGTARLPVIGPPRMPPWGPSESALRCLQVIRPPKRG